MFIICAPSLQKGAAPLLIASQEGHNEIVQKLVCVPAIQLHITAVRHLCDLLNVQIAF